MKTNITIVSLFFTALAFAQTTIQFSEPYQFLDASGGFLKVTILVNNIDQYTSGEPIIIQIFSDLEDISTLGITRTQGMDKVIFPEQYVNGEEIRIPMQPEALKNKENFSLFLKKKEGNEAISIFQGRHDVILQQSKANTSYIGISAAVSGNSLTKGLIQQKFEIPFTLEARGTYVPIEADKVFVKIRIKGVEGSDSLSTFSVTGTTSAHKLSVEKKNRPELYKKLRKVWANKKQLKLELAGLKHQSEQEILIDPEKTSVILHSKKAEQIARRSKRKKPSGINYRRLNTLDARYSFYAGVNFDINNSFKFEEAYFEMDISLLNLFRDVGLRVGIYKNNNSRSLDEDARYKWIHKELIGHDDSDITYTYKVLDVVPNVATESLGFYLQFPYNIIKAGHFSAFVSPHIELVKRIKTYTYEAVSEVEEDPLSAGITNPVLSLNHAPLWREDTKQYWDSYLGGGVSMLYRNPDKGFEVVITPIGGVGYPREAAENILFSNIVDPELTPFGAFQFHLAISTKEKLAFRLGGDIRKYFGVGQKPTISVNLATKFDLSNIMNFTMAK